MTQEKGLYRYTITSNGAQVVDLEEKKTLFRMLMKRERVVQFLRECEGLNVVRMTHIQHRYVMEGPLMEVAGMWMASAESMIWKPLSKRFIMI